MENPITLKQYLDKGKTFFIPNYQRGYIWGKQRKERKNSVEFLMESILNAKDKKAELFLQGITVSECGEYIDLIDGQQRTTFFYLLLQILEYKEGFKLEYSIRKESQAFLNELKNKNLTEIISLCEDEDDEEFQDIYFFKKSIRIIHKAVKSRRKKSLLDYILSDKVKFLYITIPQEKAVDVFTMMNGNKAVMKTEEVIKAEMLRLVSSDEGLSEIQKTQESVRWEQNLLRSRYAREWDKWLYWWNREDVRTFYYTKNVMGLLVETYFYSGKKKKEEFNFESFRDSFLRTKNGKGGNNLAAKETFYELRALQKRFEDVFNSVNDELKLHNKVGAIMTVLDGEDNRKRFIKECFGKNYTSYFAENEKGILKIDDYLKLAYLGMSHSKIIDQLLSKEIVLDTENADKLVASLECDDLYENGDKGQAFRQLLMLNVEEDTKLGRKFDFSIGKERSLEHIYPKSQCKALGKDEKIVHSIGNLVLLYKNDNSKFGDKSFDKKKNDYFNFRDVEFLKSRNLLHTISVFSKEKWGINEIKKNKEDTIKKVKEYYGIS